jgi:hypothetical protein
MTIIRYMSRSPKALFALALSLAAGSAAAQTSVSAAPDAGGNAGSVIGGAPITPTNGMPAITPGLGAVNAPVSAPAIGAPSAPAVFGSAAAVPGGAAASLVPPGATPAAVGVQPSPSVSSRFSASNAPAVRANGVRSGGTRDAAPAADAALNGTARKISEARLSESAGGDAVSIALDRAFDAATGAAALHGGVSVLPQGARGGVAFAARVLDLAFGAAIGDSTLRAALSARAQAARIPQDIAFANSAPAANAPSFYRAVMKTAKDVLPSPGPEVVAKVVRSFAARKAAVSLGELADSAFKAAAGGSAPEVKRLAGALDEWESLLGAPGHPLIANKSALEDSVTQLLQSAAAGGSRSAPHAWFAEKDGVYTAVLPGAGVPRLPAALAAAFAIAPSALAPETLVSGAYRAFAADPRASTGARVIYHARRELGASVPSAALSASRFWLRAALESLRRRLVAFFRGPETYLLAQTSGQDALRRDATLAETARGEAAAARRLLSNVRLTVAGTRAAFAALGRSADAYRTLTGEGDVGASVEALRRSFESNAAMRGLGASDELPAGLAELVSGPGAIDYWARRLEEAASGTVDGRFWRARGAAEFVNLGAADGPAAGAAVVAKAAAGAPLSVVALDDRFWARGRGANGEVRLSAELRATDSGGGLELLVESGDAGLARRLEDMGLSVSRDGAGLRAVVGPEDFAYDADELGPLASRVLAAALGRDEAGSALRDLADETRRDPDSAARLAALLDGRQAFARAPVIGLVGEYEALAPMTVSVGGKPLLVTALRDPDTGLLAYARAVRPGGAPLGAAEIRALLRAK